VLVQTQDTESQKIKIGLNVKFYNITKNRNILVTTNSPGY